MGSQLGTLFALAIMKKVVLYMIIVQWFFTLPLALYLAYSRELGVVGFFIAQSICQISNTVYAFTIIKLQDWEFCAREAQERMQKEK